MRLKKLELYGYKSFAARSVFEFGDGVTAIVGPNGSGKSNIADAIQWVMGEQSYRRLRAHGTGDMIFAGSRRRSRLGMAEVIITLDNADRSLPIDYEEVSVGRRAYRSGENEYLLNGQRVRYRDILELLGGAGLARSSYTVMGQGMVDAALALRPEARRALFEEAANIVPNLRKRKEALDRIAETERNLERVSDILNEIRPRLTSLRRQAERAEEHLLLEHDLQELQRIWYGYQWQRGNQRLQSAIQHVAETDQRLQAQRVFARNTREELDRLGQAQAEQRRIIDELIEQRTSLRDASQSIQRELAIASERSKLYAQQKDGLRDEMEAILSRRGILESEIESANAELGEHQLRHEACQQDLQAARAKLQELENTRREIQSSAQSEERKLTKLARTLADCRARIDQAKEHEARLTKERTAAESKIASLEGDLETLQDHASSFSTQISKIDSARQEILQKQTLMRDEAQGLRKAIEETNSAIAKQNAQLDQMESRHALLSRLRQELTGYYPGVREVLGTKAGLEGLEGTVANLMRVPKDLEQAIETALGPRLQNIITNKWEHAEKAIEHLKQTRAGWATFLPLDTVRSRGAIQVEAANGVIGVASELVSYDDRFRPVFELLLGTIVVVEDLTTARRMLRQRSRASLFVTLSGETVQPSGALSGGAKRQQSNLLAQEREWRDLPRRIRKTRAAMEELVQERDAQDETLAELQRQDEDLEQRSRGLQTEQEAIRAAQAQHAHKLQDVERERDWLLGRTNDTDRELEQTVSRRQLLQQQLAQTQEEQLSRSRTLSRLQEELAQENNEDLRQAVGDLETRAAVALRTVQSQTDLLTSHRRNLAQIDEQITQKNRQNVKLTNDLLDLEAARVDLERRGSEMADQREALEQRIGPARHQLAQLEEQRMTNEKQRSSSLERLNEAEMAHNRAVLERDRAHEDRASLARDIESDLGPIDLPDAAAQQLRLGLGDDILELPTVSVLPAGLEDEIRSLKTRIRRLGHINPDAPHEYEQLLDRQTFLQGQDSDLRGAIASLHEVIAELDSLIDRDFTDTFRIVNKAFGIYFSQLFKGGSAKLVLTDPENISTTGVDIIAHPPGKRAQALSLLSGGERSLTAVALLFALLKANPVPFCFLDEVDAALDEANVHRFRELLVEHSIATQFAVITHNRRTIEAAATIYGVSMGEQGVSQAISLKIDEVPLQTS